MLLFDRGFRRVSLISYLREIGHELFIIRLMGKVLIQGGNYVGLLGAYPIKMGEVVDLGPCLVRSDKAVRVRVVGAWREGEKEPWWLATDMGSSAKKIVRVYDRRTSVEEQFRDGKGARYGAQMKWTHFARPESVDRLWLLWGLSVIVWTVAGVLACAGDSTLQLMSKSKGARRSLVSVGMQALEQIEFALCLDWRQFASLLPDAVFRNPLRGGKR